MSDTGETAAATEPAAAIEYFTDPLCSWCWAFEAPWRRLRYEFGPQLSWRYRLGGLLADWNSYNDPINSITRPAQMGPVWFQVRQLTGMPIDELIWLEDPPSSSYPACLAVKAAELQSAAAAEAYLRRLREAVMLQRRNIARKEVLFAVAAELAQEQPQLFDGERFQHDFHAPAALDAFRGDLQLARYRDISRFPTLILRAAAGQAILIVGYRPYPMLREALSHLTPELQPVRTVQDRRDYAAYWGRITDHELAEMPVEAAAR